MLHVQQSAREPSSKGANEALTNDLELFLLKNKFNKNNL